jgi:putative membrane protein
MPADEPQGSQSTSRVRNAVLVGVGIALLAALLWATDTTQLLDHLRTLGWRAPLVLVPYMVIAWTDALGWRFTLPETARNRVPMRALYLTRIAGEAINSITPTATVGGEPVKAHILRSWGVSGTDGMASVVLARTALIASQSMFVAMGVGALSYRLGYPGLALGWLAGLAVATAGFVFLLVRIQQRAPASAVARLVRRVFPRWHRLDRLEEGAASVDERLGDFYRFEQRAFAHATAAHLAGWVLGVGEVLLMMALIGHPVSLLDAFVIESLSQVVRALAIVIPGGLGTQEWGGTALCQLLGIPRAEGVTLWLLKRARETIFDVIGVVYLTQRVGR